MDKNRTPQKNHNRGWLLGCLGSQAVIAVIVISIFVILFVGIPSLVQLSGRPQERVREQRMAQEDNVLRYDGNWDNWREIIDAQRVEHEVDIDRYRPFSHGNSLVVMQETPDITFTENFPRLDGATAAFPIFAAMAQALYIGLDEYTAPEFVTVSQTDIAYTRLINGEIDIFFGAQPSQQQLEMASRAGVELTMTPVAREAFVFFVHRDNLVENLTVPQIQDIYQRNVTNWSYVGGRDERIIAFQRPENSGSQTIMQDVVMRGLPMAEPVRKEQMAAMGSMIGYVAVNEYRNISSAIGYSFRYFVVGMHRNPDIKILAVNGVAPTIENIQNGTYPFLINVYAVTAGSDNENVDILLDWILSDQGQRFIEFCGIVPIRAAPPIPESEPY